MIFKHLELHPVGQFVIGHRSTDEIFVHDEDPHLLHHLDHWNDVETLVGLFFKNIFD